MSSETVTTTILADGKKVKKVVKKKKVTIDEGLNGSRRESEVTTEETTTVQSSLDNKNGMSAIESTGGRRDSELIFSDEYTKAMDKDWHSSHFSCWQCDEGLTSKRYVLRDDHPFCIKCYEATFASSCCECGLPIGVDSKDLSFKEKHWHENCFSCTKCRMSLVDLPFGSKADKIYCSNCFDESFSGRCESCNDPFKSGTKKMEFKGRQWHHNCFVCNLCKNPIGEKPFIPCGNDIVCSPCYDDKYANKCIKCSLAISTGGVTYRNEHWHKECFVCMNCQTGLAGQKFTTRENQPCCIECFTTHFAKKCCVCTKPIAGISGTKFISFEGRNWHSECFGCQGCNTSLLGKGFIADGQDLFCPDCIKDRLT